jgi:pimeloyl-ACP methyl ester carboxylesterase
MKVEEKLIHANGIRLHTLDWGGTGRSVLLLAGLGDSAQIYRSLAPGLVRDFHVTGLTRRGHGRSEKPENGYEIDTLVEDILGFLDAVGINRTILVGHSFAGLEMLRFAIRYPQRVEAIVFLDALFPKLDPAPDLSGDPVWSIIPTEGPGEDDLASKQAYLAYYRRARPALANIWCDAIESDLMEKVTVKEDGRLDFHHDDALMNHIYKTALASPAPEYEKVEVPMLAIVPDGRFHQAVPSDATAAFRRSADQYWNEKLLPWIQQRTRAFQKAAPSAQVVELDSPYHHIYIAEEDETVEAIKVFLTE